MSTTTVRRTAENRRGLDLAPAARLDLAIELLDQAVTPATKGPWRASPVWSPDTHKTSAVYSHAHPTGTPESEVVTSGRRDGRATGGIRSNPHNAVYMATMDPIVGAAVLDLLRRFRDAYGQKFNDAVVDSVLAQHVVAVVDAILDGS